MNNEWVAVILDMESLDVQVCNVCAGDRKEAERLVIEYLFEETGALPAHMTLELFSLSKVMNYGKVQQL